MSGPKPWLYSPKATADIINKYGFKFRRSLGQNFLIDSNVLKKIVSAADLANGDTVIEIGAGIGTLTQYLAFYACKVTAVEIDKRLIPVLKDTLSKYDNVALISEDILKLNINDLTKKSEGQIKVIANLPYYITSPVIINLLQNSQRISSITIMVQKEVAARMCSPVGEKNYGALTLAVNYYSNPSKIIDVSPNCFMPRPDVTSTVIRLDIKKKRQKVKDPELMFKIIKAAFAQRRKTLMNALVNAKELALSKEKCEKIFALSGISGSTRGEKLSLSQFAKLSDEAENLCNN